MEKDLLRDAFVAGYFRGNGGLPNYEEEMFETWVAENLEEVMPDGRPWMD